MASTGIDNAREWEPFQVQSNIRVLWFHLEYMEAAGWDLIIPAAENGIQPAILPTEQPMAGFWQPVSYCCGVSALGAQFCMIGELHTCGLIW